jgi:hypothetical protein
MYKVLVTPVLTYVSETWTLSKTNEQQLGEAGEWDMAEKIQP